MPYPAPVVDPDEETEKDNPFTERKCQVSQTCPEIASSQCKKCNKHTCVIHVNSQGVCDNCQ